MGGRGMPEGCSSWFLLAIGRSKNMQLQGFGGTNVSVCGPHQPVG
jgi:hypothetical protein